MLTRILKGQRGFTLIELLAVIAILTVLSGIVAGAVTGIGASGQSARLVGDQDTIGKAADRFFNDAFPQSYPALSLDTNGNGLITDEALAEAGDLGVRLVDFEAVLPGDPTKTFAPDYLKEVPDTAALVSWRIVTTTGQVFFAQDGAQLVRPSNARLDVSAENSNMSSVDNTAKVRPDHTFTIRMNKNEAALEILGIAIPAGYSIGGQSLTTGTVVGTYSGKLSTDNPFSPGQVMPVTGTLKATGSSNEWLLAVQYPNTTRCNRTHKVSIATPSEEAAGAIKIEMATKCDSGATLSDKAHNQATETWTLTIEGTVGSTNIITNPSVKGVYRWLATQHTSIDVTDLFSSMAGSQAVVIK